MNSATVLLNYWNHIVCHFYYSVQKPRYILWLTWLHLIVVLIGLYIEFLEASTTAGTVLYNLDLRECVWRLEFNYNLLAAKNSRNFIDGLIGRIAVYVKMQYVFLLRVECLC